MFTTIRSKSHEYLDKQIAQLEEYCEKYADVEEKLKQCRDMVAKMAEDLCSVQPMPSTIMKDLIDSADKRTKEQLIADGYEPVDPVSNMPLMWIKKDMVYKE